MLLSPVLEVVVVAAVAVATPGYPALAPAAAAGAVSQRPARLSSASVSLHLCGAAGVVYPPPPPSSARDPV